MSDMTEALQLGFSKLGELASKYGPPAIDTAAEVVRINAIGSLVGGAGLIVGGAVGCLIAHRHLRKFDDWVMSNPVIVMGCGGGGVVAAVFGLHSVFNVWTWVALSNPKLALAAKIVNALPGIGQ